METLVLALQSQGLRLQESLPEGSGPAMRCTRPVRGVSHAFMDSPCLEALSGCCALWEIGFPTTCIETEMRTELVDKVPAQQGSCRVCLLWRTSVVVPREEAFICLCSDIWVLQESWGIGSRLGPGGL